MKKLLCATFLAATIFPFAIASAAMAQDAAGMPEETGNLVTATATLEGDGIEGTVTLTEAPTGIFIIEIEASGLEPGPHGVHLHETGTCDAEGGHEAAGGHISGDGEHGVLNPNGPHPGDLPNVHVHEDGIAHAEFFVSDIALSGDSGTVIMDDDGAAFIIHAGPDDYMTEPAGDSGDRIACGVIEAAN